MKRSLFAALFLLAGCKFDHAYQINLSSHDHQILKPAVVNSLSRYGVIKGACTEAGTGFACKFLPGKFIGSAETSYRLQKDGSWRIVILDSKNLPLATMLKGDFEAEDLVDGKFTTEDGQLTVEVGAMVNAPPCDPKTACKPKCCKCKEPLYLLENIVVVTLREPAKKNCHPCLKPKAGERCGCEAK